MSAWVQACACERTHAATAAPVPTRRRVQARSANPVWGRLATGGHAALPMSRAGDAAERAADRAAARALAAPAGRPGAHAEPCPACAARTGAEVQPRADGPGAARAPAGAVHAGLVDGGQALPAPLRRDMEGRFGADFGAVRVHTGDTAAASARALRAQAYTYGADIVFDAGRYAPHSADGRRLLAHELAHTLQQGASAQVQRYGYEDCTDSDITAIDAADGIARQMVDKALRVINADPIDPAVVALFEKYFQTANPDLGEMREVFEDCREAFNDDDYVYECEDDCEGKVAYVYGVWSDIHLCTNKMGSKTDRYVASVIVHEFSHYYGGTDDEEYCHERQCPAGLSADDALDNADSYSGFVYDLHVLSV